VGGVSLEVVSLGVSVGVGYVVEIGFILLELSGTLVH
jgi:hypothetical protein